ncbi:MAG: threonine/serine dehydratase [Acidobacteria bacterium]|nr:threonine/serine dehydratase [Acidobacteriota bacterium]
MHFADVERARTLLRRYLPVTRLVAAAALSGVSGADVYLKLESELPTGSFKVRGALHALIRQRERGVVTSSTGNHGAAVAYAARTLGVPATVFLPEQPNPVKRARIADLGAQVIEAGRDYDEARAHAADYARQYSLYFVEDGRDPSLTPGPATIAPEILEQLPETQVIYVPIGDTTLIRGVAFAAKQLNSKVRIVGVQAARAPAYYRSWSEGRVVTTDSCDTIADGLATRCPTEENLRALRQLVDEMQLVSEEELLRAIYRLLVDEHVLAEPAGAAATAAFLARGRAHAGGKVVLLVTGANITPEILRQAALAG